MKVIVYTRPRIKVFFYELVKEIECFTEVHYMSDHRGEEEIDIMQYYYCAKKDLEVKKALPQNQFDYERIILRCRYLRSLKPDQALVQARAMTLAIERIVADYEPDLIFGMVMDSYVLDIVDLVMRTRGSQYLGFLNNMINGYSRLTARGELIPSQATSPSQVENTLEALTSKHYIPNMQKDFMWDISPFSLLFTKFFKERLKILYYFVKKRRDQDPDNFYYNTVAAKSCMSCRTIDQIFFRRFEDKDWRQSIAQARARGACILYLPLQFYPECSLDYWGTDLVFAAFYKVVEQLVANRYQNLVILVKEHPSAMGLRKSEFYRQFSTNKNMILVPFNISSNEVINRADLVLTWTGSAGVEAIMRKKCLITFGQAYYDPGYGILALKSWEQLSNLESLLLEHYQKVRYDKEKLRKDTLATMLKGLIRGYVFPLDYQSKKNPCNQKELRLLSEGINAVALRLQEVGPYPVREGCV